MNSAVGFIQNPRQLGFHQVETCREMIQMKGFFDAISKAFENDPDLTDGDSRKAVFNPKARPELLAGSSWELEMKLAGIPSTDPSSDLFAPKVRATEGFDTGGSELFMTVAFLENGDLEISDNEFVRGNSGKWQMQTANEMITISFENVGFERTFVTKGSLQSVFGGADTSRTSSAYSIPAGPCVLQAKITLTPTGRLEFSNGKILAPVTTGWANSASWKRAGTLASAKDVTPKM